MNPPVRRTLPWDIFFIGSYFAGLAAFRVPEAFSLPPDIVVHPDFPSWLIAYIGTLLGVILLSGVLLLGAAVAALGQGKRARMLAVTGAGSVLIACLMHTVFLARWERAFAQGGLIPGVMDTLLLTRTHDPSYTVQHAISAYRIGQFVVMALWAAAAFHVLGSRTHVEEELRQEAVNATVRES